jgi:hypothetical protein
LLSLILKRRGTTAAIQAPIKDTLCRYNLQPYMLESHIGRVGQNPKHIARGQTGQYTINVISTKLADVPHCGTDMTTFELYTCPLACDFVLNLESLSLE